MTGRSAYRLGQGTGPLRGLKVVEVAGIGPGPHAATLLADLGADVVRLERPGGAASAGPRETDLLTRGRPSLEVDVKEPSGVRLLLRLAAEADVLVEGMRPGVADRLGFGPEECLARNPRLVYARMTGWGQDGPLARTAGHDLNFLAVAGVLHGLGQDPSKPHFPSNLLGDFGGGSTYLVIGVLAALLESKVSGRGQVVDAAIVDGAAHLALMRASMLAGGAAEERRAVNLLDGGIPSYSVYETADGEHMAVAALEPQFQAELVRLLGIADEAAAVRDDASAMRGLLARTFRSRTQAEWTELFDGTDACVSPVLPMTAAASHPHLSTRETYLDHAGLRQPGPAPRFSRTPATLTSGPSVPGAHREEVLRAWGVTVAGSSPSDGS